MIYARTLEPGVWTPSLEGDQSSSLTIQDADLNGDPEVDSILAPTQVVKLWPAPIRDRVCEAHLY